jgi:lysophospholipase L1-like esterase
MTPRRLPPLLARAALAATATAFALVAAEAGLRIAGSRDYCVWPPSSDFVFQPDPAHLPGIDGETHVRTNRLGLRGDEVPDDPVYHVLAVGGSTTECLYLDQGESWPGRLQQRLADEAGGAWWVGNAGRSGLATDDHSVQLRHLLPQLPGLDAVILLPGVNDLGLRLAREEVPQRTQEELLRRSFAELPATGWRPRALSRLWRDLTYSRVVPQMFMQDPHGAAIATWRRHRQQATTWHDAMPDLAAALDVYERNVEAMLDQLAEADVRPIVLTQPSLWTAAPAAEHEALMWCGGVGDFMAEPGHTYYTPAALAAGMAAYNDRLLGTCARRGVEVIDLAGLLPRTAEVFYDDVHFTEAGAARVAAILADYLRKSGTEVDRPAAPPRALTTDDLRALYEALATPPPGTAARTLLLSIDGLDPAHVALDAGGTGPGTPGDWLMPYTRALVDAAARWTQARAHFPQATDTNHLALLSGTHAGGHGILGVFEQPAGWNDGGVAFERTHLAAARTPTGEPVQTLFDRAERASGGEAVTAFVSGKGWVAEMFGPAPGREAAVDFVVTGSNVPAFLDLAAAAPASAYDNPFTDPDHACDPESPHQTWAIDFMDRAEAGEHPRDAWVAEAALALVDARDPDLMAVLLGDMDHAQHFLGALGEPSDWSAGPMPPLAEGCEALARYGLVNRHNPRLRREPVMDLVHDVDLAVGRLLVGLAERGLLQDTAIVLYSDHALIDFLYEPGLLDETDAEAVLRRAGALPAKPDFYLYGAGSFGALYWRPDFLDGHPEAVIEARAALEVHRVVHPLTGVAVCPWGVMDRDDMRAGRPDLGIAPGEFHHPHEIAEGLWPDLVLVMHDHWQLPSGAFNVGDDMEMLVFNAGHGAPTTAQVLLAIRGLGFEPGTTRDERVTLSEAGVLIRERAGY